MIMETANKNDFVEIKYTGYANENVFDSNIEEDLKKIHPDAKPYRTIIIVGQRMFIDAFDRTIEGKEIGKEYEIKIGVEEGFGERKSNLVKTVPLSVFRERNTDPRPGMVLSLDNVIAKIVSVSGARVLVDFNNPLAGKEITYKFIIVRKITEEKERVDAFFDGLFKFIPKYEIEENKVKIKGDKELEIFVNSFKDRFKELIGKELVLEVKENSTPPKDDKVAE